MEINKKMYKYTAIISMTIVLVLIYSLVNPMLTIADTTYGISSINYDKNESIMTVECTRLEENVNSFLYWVYTDEEIPTKDDLDELAVWCVKNAIKVVPLDSVSIYDSINIKNTGKYYAVMLLKKANEKGTEEYVKAFVATYVVNTPIIEEDLNFHEDEEESVSDGDELNNGSNQEDEKECENEQGQELENEPEQNFNNELEQEPEKEIEQDLKNELEQEPENEPEQEPKNDEDKAIGSEDNKPLYILVNNVNSVNNDNKDEYIDVLEEENIFKPEEESETKSELEKKIELDRLPILSNLQNNTQAIEDIPQTGSNEIPVILGIVFFFVIGVVSVIKYKRS